MTDEQALLARSLEALGRAVARLRQSIERLQRTFPVTPERMRNGSPDLMTELDAFVMRFATVASSLQDQVFRAVAAVEFDTKARSSRDYVNLMEKFGVIGSADRFFQVASMRNRLMHEYPADFGRIAARLNEAWELAPAAAEMADSAISYVRSRGLLPQPG